MNFEKKELLNALVEYYNISFTDAEKFLEKFPSFVEIKAVLEEDKRPPIKAAKVTIDPNIYGDAQFHKVLADWREDIINIVRKHGVE